MPEADRSTTVGIRLPPSDRDALRALCVLPAWRDHDQSAVLRELLRREARAQGLLPPDPSAPQASPLLAPPSLSPPAPEASAAPSLPPIPPGFAVILWPLSHALPSPPAPPGHELQPHDQEPPAARPQAPKVAPEAPASPVAPLPSEPAPLAHPGEEPAAVVIERPAQPAAPGHVPSAEELQARFAAHLASHPERKQAHVASLAGLSKQDVSSAVRGANLSAEKRAKLWAWLVGEEH